MKTRSQLIIAAIASLDLGLAWNRAFKRPPAVPSATLRPVIELQPGYRAYTTPAQIRIAAEAFFENRCPAQPEPPAAPLASTVPAKPPAIDQPVLDLGGWWSLR